LFMILHIETSHGTNAENGYEEDYERNEFEGVGYINLKNGI